MKRVFIALLLVCVCVSTLQSQTLKINLQQADSLFLKENFSLLASSLNISQQKALEIQSKAYPNPNFTFDMNAYDPENKKAFHAFGSNGETDMQLEQLILLGGKRKNQIDIAKTNTALAEIEFQDLLGQLRCQLHSDLFAIGQQRLLIDKYNSQMALLDTMLTQYEVQATKGNIPLKEVVRLKGAYLSLNSDRADLTQSYYTNMAQLQTLLQTDSSIEFVFTDADIDKYVHVELYDNVKAIALKNNTDYLMIQNSVTLANQYYSLQKKQNIPDLTLNTSYDHTGGSFKNQVNIGVSIPLPIWDWNKGNIRAAKAGIDQANYTLKAKQSEILSNIQNQLAFYNQTAAEYLKAKKLYNEDFDITMQGMVHNFQKRNISIVEFVDFFDSYNGVLTEMSRIKTQLVASAEQLNLLIGKDLY